MSLRTIFEILNQAKQKYSVLSDYESLPQVSDGPVVILCENVKLVEKLIRLRNGQSEFVKGQHMIALVGREQVNFPDAFVSRVLDRSFNHDQLVSVPDHYEKALLILIDIAAKRFKDIKFSDSEKKILMHFIQERIGGRVRMDTE